MSTLHPAKTPAEIARIFGCIEQQAREQIARTAEQLRINADKARASKTGKLRGLTVQWYEDRAAAFESVL